ncbi:hypothetical protein MA16_Dca007364 [Dendrobium catenatum]|uniref:Uncharacterized protein n=1 Tax=Dendrobium catenatum TaxID=906689 RepID=A0A2I0W8N4_9ASPA|nr:hypothetical protein MA16_Dca007364 [Dendrobium catenatum]
MENEFRWSPPENPWIKAAAHWFDPHELPRTSPSSTWHQSEPPPAQSRPSKLARGRQIGSSSPDCEKNPQSLKIISHSSFDLPGSPFELPDRSLHPFERAPVKASGIPLEVAPPAVLRSRYLKKISSPSSPEAS